MGLEFSHLISTNKRAGILSFEFHLIESKWSSHIQHSVGKTKQQLSSLFHKQEHIRISSWWAQGDGGYHSLKTKTNLGCTPSSHVIIGRDIQRLHLWLKAYMYKHLEKERVEDELPSFSMLVMASPILKHCAKHGRRIMNIFWQPWLSYSMRSFFLVHEILPYA